MNKLTLSTWRREQHPMRKCRFSGHRKEFLAGFLAKRKALNRSMFLIASIYCFRLLLLRNRNRRSNKKTILIVKFS